MQLNSSVTLCDGVLIEIVRLRSAEAVDLKVSYPLMYAWSPAMSQYLFGDDKGVKKRGVFLSEPAKPAEGLNSKIMSLKRRAAGYRNLHSFITAIYFHSAATDQSQCTSSVRHRGK